MRILTLRVGQAVVLPDNVRINVTYLDDSSGRAQLGIEAPASVPVIREELVAGHYAMPGDALSEDNGDGPKG